jgi:hypothetical protein
MTAACHGCPWGKAAVEKGQCRVPSKTAVAMAVLRNSWVQPGLFIGGREPSPFLGEAGWFCDSVSCMDRLCKVQFSGQASQGMAQVTSNSPGNKWISMGWHYRAEYKWMRLENVLPGCASAPAALLSELNMQSLCRQRSVPEAMTKLRVSTWSVNQQSVRSNQLHCPL